MSTGCVGCVVVAAGSGTRLAAGRPKAFVELAGVSLLEHAVSRVRAAGLVDVVAVVPADLLDEAARSLDGRAGVVAGGAARRESVAAGLTALPLACDVVLVHDAARCLAPPELFASVAAAVLAGAGAVVPGLEVADTMKRVDGRGLVVGTVDRAELRVVQTPQGFARKVLERAHREVPAGVPATDDASLVEQLGLPVRVVPGDPLALKVTTPDDLARAQWLLARLVP